jgi:uncharacterized protein
MLPRQLENSVLLRRGTMRRTHALIAAAAFLLAAHAAAQDKAAIVLWDVLANVSFKKEKDRYVAEFSKQVAALDKREVKLKGFMLPLEQGLWQRHFLLSAQPPECGFCAPGTAEQFAEIKTKAPVKYVADPIVVSGTFALVRDDSGGLLYRLTEALVVDK